MLSIEADFLYNFSKVVCPMATHSVLIGSFGVTLLLLAFFLNLFGWLEQDNLTYVLMNIMGASLSCYASYLIHYMPFVILEGAWASVAVAGLVKKVLQ